MKKMIAFEMDEMNGQPVYVEAEVSEMKMQRVRLAGAGFWEIHPLDKSRPIEQGFSGTAV